MKTRPITWVAPADAGIAVTAIIVPIPGKLFRTLAIPIVVVMAAFTD